MELATQHVHYFRGVPLTEHVPSQKRLDVHHYESKNHVIYIIIGRTFAIFEQVYNHGSATSSLRSPLPCHFNVNFVCLSVFDV